MLGLAVVEESPSFKIWKFCICARNTSANYRYIYCTRAGPAGCACMRICAPIARYRYDIWPMNMYSRRRMNAYNQM